MAEKRIVFNTQTPNDQGGVIPNEAIDFERFDANPVLILDHQWGNTTQALLGVLNDRKLIGGKWTGVPDFHGCTEESRICKELFEKGYLKACSIGGFAEWKTNSAGQTELDKNGNRICALFDLYEVTMCALPSNRDAVTLAAAEAANYAKIFDKADLPKVGAEMVKLSSQLNKYKVEPTPEQLAAAKKLEDLEKEVIRLKAEKAAGDKTAAASAIDKKISDAEAEVLRLKAEKEAAELLKAGGATDIPPGLKGLIGDLLTTIKDTFGGKTKTEEKAGPTETKPLQTPAIPVVEPVNAQDKLPTKIELKAKKVEEAKKKLDTAKEKAEEALKKAKEAKEKAEADDATDEMKAAYEKAKEKADKAMQEAKECEEAHKAAEEDDEEEDDLTDKEKADKEKAENAAGGGGNGGVRTKPSTKPQLKTMEQLNAEHALIVSIPRRTNAASAMEKVTFSALAAAGKTNPQSDEGKIFNRVMNGDEGRTAEDYAVLLKSIMNDQRLKPILENVRLHMGLQSDAQRNHIIANPRSAHGGTLPELYARVQSGNYNVKTKDGVMLSARQRTLLTGTDTLLASPDLFTIEWLTLVIFELYASTGWKKDIPVFSANDTYNNTGLILTNINSNPPISRGTAPSNASPYTASDIAVALTMVPSFLPSMLFTPLTMHQYRYDQMGSQLAQNLAVWGQNIDDNFINTLALAIPSTQWMKTTGVQFNINSAAPTNNQFTWNASFNGNLLNAAYNDIAAIEQIYKHQNFDMTKEKAVLVVDDIMERGILQDDDTKSYLTRWTKSDDNSDNLKIAHTEIIERSRVAVYDPASNQVKDINASIPSTAQSAGLGIIPTQVGIGLGMLDMFVHQSPANYGFEISANIRSGIVSLRENGYGVTLYNYASGNV
jgi:hypothetical protein